MKTLNQLAPLKSGDFVNIRNRTSGVTNYFVVQFGNGDRVKRFVRTEDKL